VLLEVSVLAAVLAAAAVFGLVRRRTDGRLRPQPVLAERRLTAVDLGAELGDRATVVQVSTPFCQVCRPTRRMLGELVAPLPGVRFVDVSAEDRLPLVRRLGVLRTPTVLVLDSGGHIAFRGSGQPDREDVLQAVRQVV
jgi:thiol-disulfide isomerase/thioredoxin